jgi:class 3 adenylate cyclase
MSEYDNSWGPITLSPDEETEFAERMSQRILPLLRLASVIGIAAFAGYQFWDLMLDPEALSKTGPIRLGVVIWFVICIGITYLPTVRQRPSYLPLLGLVTYSVVAIGFGAILAKLPGGFVAGVGGFILGMIFIPMLVYKFWQAVLIVLPLVVLPLLTIALAGGTHFEIINAAAWIGGGAGFVIGFAYLVDMINRRTFQLEKLLEREKQRSDDLLLNILPAEVAERLKSGEEPLADYCESVTVLFADLVGFTDMSRKMPATDLVTLLNDLFSRFDVLVKVHGAEKIKTIGDAYMVASGLTESSADHVEKIASLALGMREALGEFRKQHGLDLKLRIGVHSGAVVAGVIGKQKFAYDLWGDTVNVASRMESEGLPDEIQISANAWKSLSDKYQAEPRGEIEIKGHQPTMTYLLRSRSP